MGISISELALLFLLLRSKLLNAKEGRETIAEQMRQLIDLLVTKPIHSDNRLNMYSYCVCLWANVARGIVDCREICSALEKLLDKIRVEKKGYHVVEVLRLLKENGSDYPDIERYCDAFTDVFEEQGMPTGFCPYDLGPELVMLQSNAEYLRRSRRAQNLSQEWVSEGVCAVESYSRIETGKCGVRTRNYEKLTKRLGVASRYYASCVKSIFAGKMYVY